MKTRLTLALLLLAATCVSSLCATGGYSASRQYTKENPLVYEDAWDLWPYVFLNEHGEPDGFNIDMLKKIFKELNIPYIIKLKPTREALVDLKDGHSDLMLGMAAPFHDEYASYGREVIQVFTHSVVSPKSEPVIIKTLDDLSRNKVILHNGSFSHHMMKDHGWSANCLPYDDMKEAIQKVSSENQGLIVWNTLSLKWLMQKFQTTNLQITPIDIPYGEYRFMSNDSILLHKVDSTYARLCAMDQMQPILNKWFFPERVDSGIPEWVSYVAAIICLLVFLMVYSVFLLRARENRMRKLITMHNRRLTLILRTSEINVWLYDVQQHTFATMNENGEVDKRQYSVAEFGKSYDPQSFQEFINILQQISNGETENSMSKLTSVESENQRQYIITLSVFRRSKRGKPTMIVGMMDDQTERLQNQQKSKDNMLRYQSIFSTAMVDMTYYNAEGILTDINQKACQTMHCSREELLAEHVPFYYALEDENIDVLSFESSYTTHILKSRSKTHLADSIKLPHDLYYEQLLIPVYDAKGRFLGIFGSGRDVSEFVNSYHQVKKSIEQLTSAAQDVTEYINNINYALHVGGIRLTSYSPITHQLTIYEEMNKVQLRLTQSRCLSLTAPSDKRKSSKLLDSMDFRTSDDIDADIVTTIRTMGDKKLTLQFHFVPIYDNNGDINEYIGLCRDISQEKTTETELEQKKAKAQEVENVKNVFLRNMSHEIRTPITTVVGFAELFAEEHEQEDEDGFIDEIKNNANYLLKLVNDILFLSRLDAHMVEFNKSPIDFAYSFEGHCQMGWSKHTKPGVNYMTENPYEHLIVDIDESNVGHIIERLTENAAIFTESGTVRTRYDYIGDRLLITIDDTGRGINAKQQKKLFERFDGSLASNSSGLGLIICHELVHQMGGSIDINSGEGCGTTVWVSIPCTATLIEKKRRINPEEKGES